MIVERLAPQPVSFLPLTAALRQAWACWWWSVRAHMADAHLLPRQGALEPPPAPWLDGWPRAG